MCFVKQNNNNNRKPMHRCTALGSARFERNEGIFFPFLLRNEGAKIAHRKDNSDSSMTIAEFRATTRRSRKRIRVLHVHIRSWLCSRAERFQWLLFCCASFFVLWFYVARFRWTFLRKSSRPTITAVYGRFGRFRVWRSQDTLCWSVQPWCFLKRWMGEEHNNMVCWARL